MKTLTWTTRKSLWFCLSFLWSAVLTRNRNLSILELAPAPRTTGGRARAAPKKQAYVEIDDDSDFEI